jgi:hypothetical protein
VVVRPKDFSWPLFDAEKLVVVRFDFHGARRGGSVPRRARGMRGGVLHVGGQRSPLDSKVEDDLLGD